jgi:tetratricopeptide (TPR) repeat protein
VGVVVLFSMLGCAVSQEKMFLSTSKSLPTKIELGEVPFYAQDDHQCGPTALAMVLNAAGVKVTPEQLVPQVYLPNKHGSLQVEMLASTRRNGLLAYELLPKLEDVLAEVAAGSPVLVLQNLSFSWYPVWHYAVVVGYDLSHDEIILRSGLAQRQIMSRANFKYTWEQADSWAMVAVQPGKLPATATESAYISAAVAFNATSVLGNPVIFSTAMEHWPNNLTALIGMGNSCYFQGDMTCAEKFYRQATLNHQSSVIAFNNLSLALTHQQRYSEALRSINKAITLGGPEHSAEDDTLEQLLSEMVR